MKQTSMFSPADQVLQGLGDVAVAVRMLRGRVGQICRSTPAGIIDARLQEIERRLKEIHEHLLVLVQEAK